MSIELYTLEKIQFVLSSGNTAQAERLLDQYASYKEEIHKKNLLFNYTKWQGDFYESERDITNCVEKFLNETK